MEKRRLTCIGCPMGCQLEIMGTEDDMVVTGHTCKRGEVYGRKELTNPTRIVTTTVGIVSAKEAVLPVKTASDIPKDKIFQCIQELKGVCVTAPVTIGDVILENVAGTGIHIVATKSVIE